MRNEKFVRQGKDARVDAPSAPIPVKPRYVGARCVVVTLVLRRFVPRCAARDTVARRWV
jgi:hypothetical protein